MRERRPLLSKGDRCEAARGRPPSYSRVLWGSSGHRSCYAMERRDLGSMGAPGPRGAAPSQHRDLTGGHRAVLQELTA